MVHVAALWRHPIKSHGREALDSVELVAGQTMPWDRHWAVTHETSHCDPAQPAWMVSRNFMIGTLTPGLAGIWASLDESTGRVTLRHDDLGTITLQPDNAEDAAAFLAWVAPICTTEGLTPSGIVTLGQRGMTDTPFPSIAILNQSSHAAVAGRLGRPIEIERWRGNIVLDGAAPWEEFEWVGGDLRIGDAVLHVEERIVRCKHTMANPRTGLRDADTLGTLRDSWDHQDFGIYATVTTGGMVRLNDPVEVI